MPTKKPFILSVKDEEHHYGSRGTTFITNTAVYRSHEYIGTCTRACYGASGKVLLSLDAISSCSFGSLFTVCTHTGFAATARSLPATKTVTRPCIAFNYAVFCYWLIYTIDMRGCQGFWEIWWQSH
jgi:hypothetical protein